MKILQHKNFTWYKFNKLNKQDLQYLRRHFPFDALDIEDCKKVIQRPKLDIYKVYFFMILRVPLYNKKLRRLGATEVDIFMGKDFMVTITQSHIKEIESFFKELKKDTLLQRRFFKKRGIFFYEFLNQLYLRNFRILDHIAEDLEKIEKGIFRQQEQKKMVQEISIVHRNIINFRRIMRAHDVVLNKIIKIKNAFLDITRYYHKKNQTNLLEHLNNAWDIIDSHRETIEALQNTNESLISSRLNRILLVLTIISVCTLPATFFSINSDYIPFYNNPFLFWYVLGFTIILGIITFIILKRKKVL